MAFVPNPQDPNQQPAGAGGIPGQGVAPVSTSAAPNSGPGASTTGGGVQPSNQGTGQPFTNLQAYLTANAPQVQNQAQTIAGNLTNQYQQTQGAINQGASDFAGQVSSGYTAPNQQVVDQATQNPSQFVQTPGNVQQFQSLLNDQYTGPTAFEQTPGYQTLNQNVTDAASNANLVNTPSGMQTYLQKGSTTNPTAGDTLLDSVLLQGNPEAYQSVLSAAKPFSGLSDYLSQNVQTQDQGITAAQTAAQQAQAAAQAGLTTAQGNLTSNVNQELQTDTGLANTYNQDVGQLRGVAGDYVTAIQNYLAQNPQLSSQLADLSPWANLQQVGAPTAANAASANDYSTLAALSQLSGGNVFNAPINATDTAQGGTFALPQDLQAALSSGAVPGAMTQELQGLQGQITSAYQPFQQAEKAAYNWQTYGMPAQTDMQTQQQNLDSINANLQNATDPKTIASLQAAATQLQSQIAQDQATIQANPQASWDAVGPLAQGLQWLPGAATGYNDLVSKLNAELQGLTNLSVPTITPPDLSTPTQTQQAANSAALATGVGAPVAAGAEAASGLGAAQAGSAADLAAEMGTSPAEAAALQAQEAGTSSTLGEGLGTGVNTIGPAALAAYGTSNIIKNAAANPIESGLGTAANMGLSLATLSLPPNILNSIEGGLKNVMDNIGKFFGNLF